MNVKNVGNEEKMSVNEERMGRLLERLQEATKDSIVRAIRERFGDCTGHLEPLENYTHNSLLWVYNSLCCELYTRVGKELPETFLEFDRKQGDRTLNELITDKEKWADEIAEVVYALRHPEEFDQNELNELAWCIERVGDELVGEFFMTNATHEIEGEYKC